MTSKKEKRKTTSKKILIPLKFRGKPFLGLAQLSKIFTMLVPFKLTLQGAILSSSDRPANDNSNQPQVHAISWCV